MKPESLNSRLRNIVIMALSIALAAAGAFIKIPSPVGTVALDSWPGYACAVLIGPSGAWVAFAGHLASGLTSGFPLGLSLHVIVAVQMGLCALGFRWATRRFGSLAGIVVAIVLNGLAAPLALIPWIGRPMAVALLVPLTSAAVVNVIAASLVVRGAGRLFISAGNP